MRWSSAAKTPILSRRTSVGWPTKSRAKGLAASHKAKGLEFDDVVVAHCSRTPFGNEEQSRRLLYVAMSRARRSLLILASAGAPSPLLAGA